MTKKRYFFKGYKVPVYVKTGICQTQSEVFASKNATNADNKKSFKMSKARGVEGIFGVVKQKAIEASRAGLPSELFANSSKSTQRTSRKRQENAL